MSFKERLKRYRTEAKNNGVPDALIGPLPYQVLWAIGVPVTPPLHQSFLGRLLTIGIPAGLAFGILMAIAPSETDKASLSTFIGMGIGFGVLFGAFWATLALVLKRRFNVPPWHAADEHDEWK